MSALLLALALGAPVEIGKKDDRPDKAELEKLQGIWKLTERETSRRTFKATGSDLYTLVVGGESYVLHTHAGALKVDPAKKTVELTIAEGRYKGTTVPGLYELSGDTLKIAIHPPAARGPIDRPTDRPTDLKPTGGAAHTLYSFERDGKATKDDVAAKLKDLKASLAAAGGPGFPAGAAGFPPPRAAADQATQDLLRKVMDKLEAIDKRLDAIEKRLPPTEKK